MKKKEEEKKRRVRKETKTIKEYERGNINVASEYNSS